MLSKKPEQAPDAWTISFDTYDPADEGRRESILALGNGFFVTRAAGCDASADDVHYPGTYRAGCYDRLVSQIAGETVETEELVNLPNWLAVTFRIGSGPWFRLDAADILRYSHALDLTHGISRREFTFRTEEGHHTRIREWRLVSMADPHLASLRLELLPQDWSGEVEFRSALDGDVVNANVLRYAPYERHHLVPLGRETTPSGDVVLRTCTRQSRIEIVQALRTQLRGVEALSQTVRPEANCVAHHIRAAAKCRRALAVEKTVALYTTRDPAVCQPHKAAKIAIERAPSFSRLRTSHQQAWRRLWACAGLEIDREDVARAVHLHAFHILQTASPHSTDLDVGVPARGWHGEAYRGHVFWDEIFVFPFLNFRFPALARSLLLYRYRRLGEARAAARAEGYRGAMYPWRSASNGAEVTPRHQLNLLSGRWMRDHTHLQRHIGSAVAFNVWQYYLSTGDADFLARYGAEMLLEIARFWASIAQFNPHLGRFEIRGVIGPDEYHNAYPQADSPGLDNNSYTNMMAVWSLCRALEVLQHLSPKRRDEICRVLCLGENEIEQWDRLSRRMHIPFHGDGIISQFEGFEKLSEFSPHVLPAHITGQRLDWALEAVGESADDYQVTKQADVLTLYYLLSPGEFLKILNRLGYDFDRERLGRTAAYYLTRTTHRSSLSRIVYSGALAQVDPTLSWRLYRDALGTDLDALKGESIAEGIHLGAMGGTIDVLQRHYLGISPQVGGLHLDPALPRDLGPVRMSLRYQDSEIEIRASGSELYLRSASSNRKHINIFHPQGRIALPPGEGSRIRLGDPSEQ